MLSFTAAVPAYALRSFLHSTISLVSGIYIRKIFKTGLYFYISTYRHHLENLLSVRLSPYSIKHARSNKPCQTIAHYITKFNALK